MKKLVLFVSLIVFAFQSILPVAAVIDLTQGVNAPTKWVNVTPASNSFDYLTDQQTGSGSVSQDLVGGNADFGSGAKDYGVFYIQYDDQTTVSTSDDELGFRFRVNNADGVHKDTFQFYAFLGLDYDLNGSIDLFMGIYNPDNNGSKSISIYSSDPGKLNISPSTTGFGDKLYEVAPVHGDTWDLMQTDDGSMFSGDVDYFVSFKINVAEVDKALKLIDPTWALTTTTPLRILIGTASQANSYNQDMGGINGIDTKSDTTWASMGVYMPPFTPTGTPVEVNLAPTAQNQDLTLPKGTSVKFKLAATDPEGDSLTYTPLTTDDLSDPTCGTLSGPDVDGYYNYTDNGTCTGSVTLEFTANDGTNDSNVGTITITPTNTIPVADDQQLDVDKSGSVKFKLTGSDADNDPLTFPVQLILLYPTCGTLTGPDSDGYFTYTDNGTCSQANEIQFIVNDGTDDSLAGTITLTPKGNQLPDTGVGSSAALGLTLSGLALWIVSSKKKQTN